MVPQRTLAKRFNRTGSQRCHVSLPEVLHEERWPDRDAPGHLLVPRPRRSGLRDPEAWPLARIRYEYQEPDARALGAAWGSVPVARVREGWGDRLAPVPVRIHDGRRQSLGSLAWPSSSQVPLDRSGEAVDLSEYVQIPEDPSADVVWNELESLERRQSRDHLQ